MVKLKEVVNKCFALVRFHIVFGIDLLIILILILLTLPYAVQKTGNILVGIWIHGLRNSPMFVFVSLGVIS